MQKKWTKIEDSKVQAVWKCPICGEVAVVEPTFYQGNGTPICGNVGSECEGDDMIYVRTEVLLSLDIN